MYSVPVVSPATAFWNGPTPAASAGASVTPAPPSSGFGLLAVGAYTTPRASTALPPALETVPPSTADVIVTPVTVGEITVGGGGAAVVTVAVQPYTRPAAFSAKGRRR